MLHSDLPEALEHLAAVVAAAGMKKKHDRINMSVSMIFAMMAESKAIVAAVEIVVPREISRIVADYCRAPSMITAKAGAADAAVRWDMPYECALRMIYFHTRVEGIMRIAAPPVAMSNCEACEEARDFSSYRSAPGPADA